jgi:hypothetical protein
MEVTQDRLKAMFDYRQDGNLVRRHSIGGNGNGAGQAIGTKPKMTRNSRYSVTKIEGAHWCVHKLVYLYHYGQVPKHLDHINGNTADNRIENLREATASENMMNRRTFSNNKSGHKGVAWSKHHDKWYVYMDVNKIRSHFGYYDDLEIAALLASEVRDLHHGNFVCHS